MDLVTACHTPLLKKALREMPFSSSVTSH